MRSVRVLLSEGSSLTARETITCLGPAGCHLEVLDSAPLCLARFSRWVQNVHSCPAPGRDPIGYLQTVKAVAADRRIEVILPTHEQAWLFAAGRSLMAGMRMAVSDIAAFDRVESKIEFAKLLDELALPQPRWRPINSPADLTDLPFPYWLKTAFSTAGRGVRQVVDERSRAAAVNQLLNGSEGPVMAQQPAAGQYGQVQGLFDHGRLVAAHTSVQTGIGIGPSAAGRLSVDHSVPRKHIAMLGDALAWHGGITLDYLHRDGDPQYIECNPRTVEPGNATASGVNLPWLQVRLTEGDALSAVPLIGRPGVRTHGTLALILGAAAYQHSRRAVLKELGRTILRQGCYRRSAEQLTPLLRDPPSAAALAFVIAEALGSPERAARLASKTAARYSIPPDAISTVRS